jgi:hypothetical protein
MAPIKFEEHIREKLQERELQPSSAAWEKLETQLESKAGKGNNKVLWLAIAASIAGLFVIGSLVYNPSRTKTEMVVEENSSEGIELENKPEVIQEDIAVEAVALDEIVPDEILSEKLVANKSEDIQKKQQESNKETIALVDAQKVEKIPIQDTSIIIKENSFENNKIDEVVAKVKEIQKANNTITVDEVEALLIAAQRDIKTQQFLAKNTQKVDAAALLLDVEFELERGFRDKVFDALGEGFQKIRTAVTERNN